MTTSETADAPPDANIRNEEGGLLHKLIAIVLTAFVGYSALSVGLNVFQRLSIFLAVSLIYLFLRYPLIESVDRPLSRAMRWVLYGIDGVLILATAVSLGYLAVNSIAVMERSGLIREHEIALGFVAIFVVIEATRRTINLFIPIFTLVFVAYTYLGPELPGVFGHPGFTTRQIMVHMYTTTRGLFSFPLAVMFDYVFLFILFGALLEYSGGANFFLDFAKALLGKVRGGPAKLAVVSSGFMGMLSGSSVANVLTSGSVTIPLMKKSGYDRDFAGGVESAASTGGQLMPPVMGAAIFIMVEITGLAYSFIIVHALLPALLYFACLYFVVHFESLKKGLNPLPDDMVPAWGSVLSEAYFVVPFSTLVYLILQDFSIQRSIIYSLGVLVVVTAFSRDNRLYDPRREGESVLSNPFINGIERTAYRGAPIVAAATCVGIVIGVVGLTGIGLKLSSILLDIGGGNLAIILILTMVLSIVFGMAMDTVTVYVLQAVIIAPILTKIGVETFAAHLFIFYFGLMAMVTPPICIAAYAAASLAEADPMDTGFWAWRIALAAFILPFAFVYNPELLLIGLPVSIGIAVVTALLGVLSLAASVVGYVYIEVSLPERAILFVASILLIGGSNILNLAGLGLFLLGIGRNLLLLLKGRKPLEALESALPTIASRED